MSSKIELLPCPFCGGEAVLKQYRADGLEIKCSSCHSGRQQRWMYKGRDWLAEKMIEKWNERSAPPELAELQATIAQQAAEIERLKGGKGEASHFADEYNNTITAEHKAHNVKCGGAPRAAVERYKTPLYASQPASVSVVSEDVLRLLQEASGVLQAFSTVSQTARAVDADISKYLAKVKELNQ